MARVKQKRGRKAPPRARRSPVAPARPAGERLELAMRAINEGVYDWDVAGGTIHYSEGVYSVLHMPRSMKTPADWRKRIHPDDLAAYEAAILAHFRNETERFECDYRYRARDRSWRWARQHGIAQRDARGRAVRMTGSTGDITELKRIEQALKESEQRYSLATQAATEGIYEWNLETGSLYLSERAKAFFAVKGDALTPAAWNKRVHGEDFQGYRDAIAKYFKGRKPQFEHEYRIRNASGGYSWVVDRAVAVRGKKGRTTRLVGALSDITQRRLHEEELRSARDQANAALERQTVTADILKVMASSPSDVQPVFDAIASGAARLCDASFCVVFRYDGTLVTVAADDGRSPGTLDVIRAAYPAPPGRHSISARAILERRVIAIADAQNLPGQAQQSKRAKAIGYRSILAVPMMRGDVAIGTINVARFEVRPFTDAQAELLKTFADQAVIAIENVRLFNETREALEQQKASGEVLSVIGSSIADTAPVFDKILESCERLFAGRIVGLNLVREDGMLHIGAYHGAHREEFDRIFPIPLTPESGSGLAIVERRVVHYPDAQDGEEVPPRTQQGCKAIGVKSVIFAPMLWKGRGMGAIFVGRDYVSTFSEKEIALLRTFADQAAIAVENVRLFNETKEALERQTATAEILKVISSSPTDVQPVFDAIARSAFRLLSGAAAGVLLRVDDGFRLVAMHSGDQAIGLPPNPDYVPIDPAANFPSRVFLSKAMLHIPDWSAIDLPVHERGVYEALGVRSSLMLPLLREEQCIGVLFVTRSSVRAYSDKEIGLMQSFVDQAVIAIENVRLFNETKEGLERQTAISDILRVISSSPSDVKPVLDAVAERAARICEARVADIILREGETMRVAATFGDLGRPLGVAVPLDRTTVMGRSIVDQVPVHVPDLHAEDHEFPLGRELAIKYGHRTILGMPLVREGRALGTILVRRAEVRPFEDKHLALLKTFADQAAIAIENARLFNETKEALERQTATAEILRVIASSPTDVQPVFDVIVQSAVRLCGARFGRVYRYDGSLVQMIASHGLSTSGLGQVQRVFPRPAADDTIVGHVILTRRPYYVKDIGCEQGVPALSRQMIEALGTRSQVTIPMLRAGESIGAITMGWGEPEAFDDQQVALLQTFADQAVIAIENVRLFNETKEALERQTATAEILRVIASSPSDVQPVFDAIAGSALRLIGGTSASVARIVDGMLHLAALTSTSKIGDDELRKLFPAPLTDRTIMYNAAIGAGAPVVRADTETHPDVSPRGRELARVRGYRSQVAVPMTRDGSAIGAIVVARCDPGEFSGHEIGLLETFADQAVIAIENVRLFNETKEALERQTATGEVLASMSGSMTDAKPVFDAIVRNLLRLFGTQFAAVQLLRDGVVEMPAVGGKPGFEKLAERFPRPLDAGTIGGQVMLSKRVQQFAALDDPAAPEGTQQFARDFGFNSVLFAPMIHQDKVIGAIGTAHPEGKAFDHKQIALIKSFADQAVIAIENVRLFNETKEALERQTATAEILKVIASSPSDVQPVFDAIARSALRLIGGSSANVTRRVADELHLVAFTATNASGDETFKKMFPTPLTGQGVAGKAVLGAMPAYVSDFETDPAYSPSFREMARARNARSIVAVPMIREGAAIGAISVSRPDPGQFTDHQINLLKTFADQAVIAIENVRLFNETREALERQTATAEILRVIGGSMTDTQPVFDAIVKNCRRLFEGSRASLWLISENLLHQMASTGENAGSMPIDRGSGMGACVLDERVIHLPDLEESAAQYPRLRQLGLKFGYRSGLYAPLLRDGRAIGGMSVLRREAGAFDDKAVGLLKTFTDQAVIAIENVRLFKELESRTEALTRSVGQLTALGEVGQAISSTLDIETVLKTIVSRAIQLAGLDAGVIYEYDEIGDQFQLRASENFDDASVAGLRGAAIRKGEGAVGTSVVTREPTQVPDTHAPDYPVRLRELLDPSGYRAILAVPLLREGSIIGALMVIRKVPGSFAPEIVELLKTFATQSAMAIQNARLFREIAEKGKQLEEASHHKSQFLASMSHELRTPLNAILGFNEMIIGQVYGEVPQDMQEPLEDIQKSGKHLLRLINNVLDLAKIEAGRMELSLSDYSVQDTVESVRSTLRPLAAEKGLEFLASVPNELPLAYGDGGRITQCLMNLAGNSLKFTKAGKVEISVEEKGELLVYKVADTGIGIPPDKIASLFTEFKQTDATIASEYGGTGLGLSISRKFIEMHGGRIWVESELGRGSAFIFEVPLRAKTA